MQGFFKELVDPFSAMYLEPESFGWKINHTNLVLFVDVITSMAFVS